MLSSSALVFDTTPPSAEPAHTAPTHRAIYLNHGWLHRVMGVSPPAGSLSAALLAWSPFRWGLGLDGSIIVPDGVIAIQLAIGCFVDGWTRLAPYLAVVDRGIIRQAGTTEQKCIGDLVCSLYQNLYRWSWRILQRRFGPFSRASRQRTYPAAGYFIFKAQTGDRSYRYSQYRANWARMLFNT